MSLSILDYFKADIKEMEASAIAEIAHDKEVVFLAIKAIVNFIGLSR